MQIAYLDDKKLTERSRTRLSARLEDYAGELVKWRAAPATQRPEYALYHGVQPEVAATLEQITDRLGAVKEVLLLGIGGSSLGVEAVHDALPNTACTLTVIDALAPSALQAVLTQLQRRRSLQSLAICIVSKSGTTTETMVNASVILSALEDRFGAAVYERVVCISDQGSPLLRFAKRQKASVATMPAAIGGRYSVGTEVGLVPLALLGHDARAFAAGIAAATEPAHVAHVSQAAARLAWYITQGYQHYNFFAFHPDLYKLGAWYRQLQAESLGKSKTRSGTRWKKGLVPTISTPVELHSMGQLYLSGYPGVYTDFVAFADEVTDQPIPRRGLAKAYARHSVAEVATALYGGVLGAYQERALPYRSTLLNADETTLGRLIGSRLLEVMMVGRILDLNPFDQPNVELYKNKTRGLLGL